MANEQYTHLAMEGVMRQAKAVAEEYVRAEVEKVIEKIKEEANAKAMVQVSSHLKAFQEKIDYSTKSEINIVLNMGGE